MCARPLIPVSLFFHDAPPIQSCTLSLHDALPISFNPGRHQGIRNLLGRRRRHGDDGQANAERWDDLDDAIEIDRKSTRLNSSHLVISYAVFCLKKKN